MHHVRVCCYFLLVVGKHIHGFVTNSRGKKKIHKSKEKILVTKPSLFQKCADPLKRSGEKEDRPGVCGQAGPEAAYGRAGVTASTPLAPSPPSKPSGHSGGTLSTRSTDPSRGTG